MTDEQEASNVTPDVLQAKIALETAQIGWLELERFFAAGKAIAVDHGLDLVEVATALANDDKTQFEGWLAQGRVKPVTDDQAGRWHNEDLTMWAVVVAPWVLVQPIAAS